MIPVASGLTPTAMIAAAASVLASNGYHEVQRFRDWESPTSRLFEDEYNVVGVVVFDTCTDLVRQWPDHQGSLVDLISEYIGQSESKSWDGYLALLTPSLAPSADEALEAVRYNTDRLRKLVASGDDLRLAADVERVLSPLLPLQDEQTNVGAESVLDLLPNLLAKKGIERETTLVLLDAQRTQTSFLEQLVQRGEA